MIRKVINYKNPSQLHNGTDGSHAVSFKNRIKHFYIDPLKKLEGLKSLKLA